MLANQQFQAFDKISVGRSGIHKTLPSDSLGIETAVPSEPTSLPLIAVILLPQCNCSKLPNSTGYPSLLANWGAAKRHVFQHRHTTRSFSINLYKQRLAASVTRRAAACTSWIAAQKNTAATFSGCGVEISNSQRNNSRGIYGTTR